MDIHYECVARVVYTDTKPQKRKDVDKDTTPKKGNSAQTAATTVQDIPSAFYSTAR